MKPIIRLFFGLFFVSATHAQIRVVNYNIASLRGDHDAIKRVLTLTSEDDSHGKAISVSIFLFQEVPESKVKQLHELLGSAYSKATFTDQGESSKAGAQAAFYDSTKLIEKTESHKDIYTGAGRYTDRWEFQGIGKYERVSLWIYSAHLKASKGSTNREQRESGAKAILEDIATLPEGSNVLVVGDMNFYTNKEPAYQTFVEILIDPLGTDEWAGADDAQKHTQSPRTIRDAGLIHGGLDDRFDFQFISKSLQDGKDLDIIRSSYHALGNDGEHYDIAINEGDNEYYSHDKTRSNELATALHEASDHIPVIADYDVIKQEKANTSTDTTE